MKPLVDYSDIFTRGRLDPLLQLVFRAEFGVEVTEPAAVSLGEGLVLQSRKAGVFGLFCIQGVVFSGIIEGPSDVVISLIEDVSNDVRLDGLTTLREAQVQRPRLGNAVFSYLTTPDAPNSETVSANAFADRLARLLQRAA